MKTHIAHIIEFRIIRAVTHNWLLWNKHGEWLYFYLIQCSTNNR